jgi:hypothetical protein
MPYPHKFIKLTPAQKKQVDQALKHFVITHQYRRRKRLQIIYLSDQGKTFREISRRLGVSYRTVKRRVSLYQKEGLDPLLKGAR